MESYGQRLEWTSSCEECGNDSQSKKVWARTVLEDAEYVMRFGSVGTWRNTRRWTRRSSIYHYHQNNYSFRALQAYCFRFNM